MCVLAFLAIGCSGPPGDFSGGDDASAADTGNDGGAELAPWQCAEPDSQADPALPPSPYFVDATQTSGLSDLDTYGFGRVQIVDLDADGDDDVVGTPAHDGTHTEPPGDFDRLVLRNEGDGTFTDFTLESGLADAAVGFLLFGDVDDDGDPDLFAGVIEGRGLDDQGIWTNDGAGHFAFAGKNGTDVRTLACGASLTCTQRMIGGAFADFDGDGLLDLYVGGWFWSDGVSDQRWNPPSKDSLYRGVGGGRFEDVTDALGDQTDPLSETSASFGRPCMGVSAGDWDDDGDQDLFVANYGAGRPVGPFAGEFLCEPPRYWDRDILWRNDGAMSWTDVADDLGIAATTRGPDGVREEVPLLLGDECPAEVRGAYASPIGGNSFTSQFGDFDGDGDLDLVVGNIAHPDYVQSDPTLLFVNQGPPDYAFVEEGYDRGLVWREDDLHPHFVDVDGDGRLDLASPGQRDDAVNFFRVYRQSPDHRFALQSNETTGVDDHRQQSIGWLDYDADGDLDLYVAEDDADAKLFENVAADASHDLAIRLVATAPRDATGARITLQSTAGTQIREVTAGHGHYNMQLSRTQFFGLGGDRCAADVTIRWPNGEIQTLGDVRANQTLVVTQGGTVEIEQTR